MKLYLSPLTLASGSQYPSTYLQGTLEKIGHMEPSFEEKIKSRNVNQFHRLTRPRKGDQWRNEEEKRSRDFIRSSNLIRGCIRVSQQHHLIGWKRCHPNVDGGTGRQGFAVLVVCGGGEMFQRRGGDMRKRDRRFIGGGRSSHASFVFDHASVRE